VTNFGEPIDVRHRITELLEQLVRRDECVLTYDTSLLSQLPDILLEQHGIASESQLSGDPRLQELFSLLGVKAVDGTLLSDLPSLLERSGISLARYSVMAPEAATREVARDFDHWTERRANEDLTSVLALQRDLGSGRFNAERARYGSELEVGELRNYLRGVTSAPPSIVERLVRRSFWELKLGQWKRRGWIDPDRPSLSIGPRWVTEIRFFREIVGLRRHVGLDLFSDDPELVTAGDMHDMPFPAAHFGFVFLKNVVDKSYDVRRLVRELIRVVRPGGIIVVDQVCGYGNCTPVTRTDIQRARNFLRLFEARARAEALVCDDVDISGIGDARATNARRFNARLAVRLTPVG
jgi:SAM-dependent methyltransferase